MSALGGGERTEGDALMRPQLRREPNTVEGKLSALPKDATPGEHNELIQKPL